MEPEAVVSTQATFEFNEEQNATIKSLASSMRWVGAVLLVVGVLQCIAGALTFARGGLSEIVQGAILIVFSVFTYKAATAFREIVDTAGQDIAHLMAALCSLRSLYRLQVIILAIAALAFLLMFGAIALGALAK